MNPIYTLLLATCCLSVIALAATKCEEHRQRELALDSVMKFVPECTEEGDYAALQCFEVYKKRVCMCFTPNGRQINGPAQEINTCDCHSHRNSVLEEQGASRGRYVPTCNEDGTYTRRQCNWKSGMCWCTDEKGNRISEEVKGKISC